MTTLPSGLPVVVQRADTVPLAAQISAQLEAAVTGGVLHSGDRLPSSRDLAASLGVSRTAVTNAYARLFAEGWLEGRHAPAATWPTSRRPPRPCVIRPLGPLRSRVRSRRRLRREPLRGPASPSGGPRRSISSPASPGQTGSSRPPGGARGGRRARTSRPGGPTHTGSRSSGRRSPPTSAGHAGLPSRRSRF